MDVPLKMRGGMARSPNLPLRTLLGLPFSYMFLFRFWFGFHIMLFLLFS